MSNPVSENRRRHAARVLIYGHDTFGLGHLRRCRAIAHALVRRYKNMSVLILTGSSIIGRFDFLTRVDFVRIPGVIKLRNGEYTPLSLHMDIDETIAIRERIIRHTAESFAPDAFIVDKEALGLRGELTATLPILKGMGTVLILGLRDILDEATLLKREWERKQALQAIKAYYDEIWVYGVAAFYNPLSGLDLDEAIKRRIHYSGYLASPSAAIEKKSCTGQNDFILVTTGGGGDGEALIETVLRAYEQHPRPALLPAYMVLGPFMSTEHRVSFLARIKRLDDVDGIEFDDKIEPLIAKACGIVSMGGYNAFCEGLAMNKQMLIFPRRVPRLEQYLRAQRAHQWQLAQHFDPGADDETIEANCPQTVIDAMITALQKLPQQPRPDQAMPANFLDGFDWIAQRLPALLTISLEQTEHGRLRQAQHEHANRGQSRA